MCRLFIIVFCAVCAGAQAQTSQSLTSTTGLDAYWTIPLTADQKLKTVLTESLSAIPDATSSVNTIILNQSGSGNQASLQTLSGLQNRLEASQTNTNNVLEATVSGVNNSAVLLQTGSGNVLNLDLSGSNNRFRLEQDGNDTARMQGLQKDNTRLELVQGSGSNSFTLDNTSVLKDPLVPGIANLRIEQTGGASITIQQGKVIGN